MSTCTTLTLPNGQTRAVSTWEKPGGFVAYVEDGHWYVAAFASIEAAHRYRGAGGHVYDRHGARVVIGVSLISSAATS